MNRKPILLITGASGFTGEHACKHFSKNGYEIIALSRLLETHSDDWMTMPCDLTKKEEVYQLIRNTKPDYLLHLAGKNHVGDSWENPLVTLESNLLSTLYILEATRLFHPACKILMIGSTLQTDIHSPIHPYGLSKSLQLLLSKTWVTFYKMNIVMAKTTNLIGPGKSNGVSAIIAKQIAMMENMELDPKITIQNRETRIDFLDVRDAVAAYETLLRDGVAGEEYEVLSGKSYSLGELIQAYKERTTIDFQVQSLEDSHVKSSPVRQPDKLLSLGWRPTFPLQHSIKDTLEYYRNQYPK